MSELKKKLVEKKEKKNFMKICSVRRKIWQVQVIIVDTRSDAQSNHVVYSKLITESKVSEKKREI